MTVKKMYEDLDYWIHIGIGDDIIHSPEHRPEYQHLVAKAKSKITDIEQVPLLVLMLLRVELKKPFFLQPTFWRLVWLKLTRKIK